MQKLARYWATDYDWRKCEARLNALPQFVTKIDGLDIHFIHVRSKHPNALPMIITHGWPGSIIEQLKIIDPLTDPTAHGGSAADAFDVVIPSLPGYGFSGKPTTTGWDPQRIARAWVVLMTRLGYTRYVAQGGDWGNAVTEQMASADAARTDRHSHQHAGDDPRRRRQGASRRYRRPPACRPTRSTRAISSTSSISTASATRRRWRTARRRSMRSRIRRSAWRPGCSTTMTVAALIARVFDGTSRGADAGRHSRQRHALLADEHRGLLGASLLGKQARLLRAEGRPVPVAVSAFPDELYTAPRSWTEKAYPKLIHYNRLPKGGHFAAWEQPQSFTEELRTGFRTLR